MSRPLPLQLTEAAEADLAELWATIATDASEEIATRFLSRIHSSLEPLRHHPELGPQREHLTPGLRVTFQAAYAIYYRPLTDAVVIVRVLRGARDVAAIAERGGLV